MSAQCEPSVTVTLEEYIWFFLSDALKRSACSFLRRETPHLFFPLSLPLNWKDRPTPFLASWYIIRHGAVLEASQPASPSSALSERDSQPKLPASQAPRLFTKLWRALHPEPTPWGSLLAVLLITRIPCPRLNLLPRHGLWPVLPLSKGWFENFWGKKKNQKPTF